MKHLRIYSDENSESRIEEVSAEFSNQIYAPPAPAFDLTAVSNAQSYVMVRFPAGWTSELHPTPRRQIFIMLAGEIEGGLSDGSTFILQSGDTLLMEDTTGKGHTARPLNDQDAHAIMVHLDENPTLQK